MASIAAILDPWPTNHDEPSVSTDHNKPSVSTDHNKPSVSTNHGKPSISYEEKEKKRNRRARFNHNPVAEVRSIPSPASSTSSLAPSPGPSTPPPLPDVEFSSPAHSPTLAPYGPPPRPRAPSPQAHLLPFIPPAPLTPGVYINPALAVPSLRYDMRSRPSHSNPRLSPAVLSTPASSPPLPSLTLRVGDLPWQFTSSPDAGHSSENPFVTIQDVLLAIYLHLRMGVNRDEYEALSRSRKTEVFQAFETRVGTDPVQRGKGLRRVDLLGRRFRAQGLVRAQSEDSVWNVVIQ